MYYALFGDIHSSKEDLEKVLTDITEKAPEAISVGTGDLFECTISKRDITDKKFRVLEEVMLIPEGFPELLTFFSVQRQSGRTDCINNRNRRPPQGKTFYIAGDF